MNNPLLTTLSLFLIVSAASAEDQPDVESPKVPTSILTASKQQNLEDLVQPLTVKVKPGVNEIIPVAIRHLNRIVTPFDTPQVRTVSQATTEIEGNILYVAPGDETPITLYITPNGQEAIALSVTLAPRRIPAREIRLTLDRVQYKKLESLQTASASDRQIDNAPQDYIGQLKTMFRSLALMKIPKGYAMRAPAVSERIQCSQAGLKIDTGQVFDGHNLILLVGLARNTGSVPVEFDERTCANQRLGPSMAVAAWPNVFLEPGATTEVYVVMRSQDERKTMSRRPSLIAPQTFLRGDRP